MRKKPKYADLGDHDEDFRIKTIGDTAMTGKTVAFIVDADPGKAERYISKLLTRYPELQVLKRFPGPVQDTEAVTVGRMETPAS